jgi:hypothetical protein
MLAVNKWISKSIAIANSNNYLDNLMSLYPLAPNPERKLPKGAEEMIKEMMSGKDENLIPYLLKLEKFPIDNSYVGSLKYDNNLLKKNPRTVKAISKILYDMGFEDVIHGAKEPKRRSKQIIGSDFSHWLSYITGYPLLDEAKFNKTTKPVFLSGADETRKTYANNNLNARITEKGIDLLFKKNSKFVLGQAKFITAYGGGQTGQLNEALSFINNAFGGSTRIAVLDGVIWFDETYLKMLKDNNKNIMSALVLKDFFASFR